MVKQPGHISYLVNEGSCQWQSSLILEPYTTMRSYGMNNITTPHRRYIQRPNTISEHYHFSSGGTSDNCFLVRKAWIIRYWNRKLLWNLAAFSLGSAASLTQKRFFSPHRLKSTSSTGSKYRVWSLDFHRNSRPESWYFSDRIIILDAWFWMIK